MNDLIERAIQSAKARIYKLEQGKERNHTARHQEKAENQIELQKVTVEALKKQKAMKPICKEMPYSESIGFNDEYYCPVCNGYVGYGTEGMSEPEQMEYCADCGQHIARDWGEE